MIIPTFLQYYLFIALCVVLVLHLREYTKKKRKWKSTAILLTVLFGGLSWFYTYKMNKKRCWLILLIALVAIPFPVILAFNTSYFFEKIVYPLFGTTSIGQTLFKIVSSLVIVLLAIPGFVWPVLTHMRRPAKFYRDYYKS